MKRIICGFLFCFLLAGLVQAKELIVYSPFSDEVIQALAGPFTRQTGIRVINMVISSGEIRSRVRAERNRPQADFWLSVRANYLKEAFEHDPPLILAYTPSNIQEIYAPYQYPDVPYLVGVGMYPLVFFYNTRVMERQGLPIPKTWDDLLKPEYKGKLVMPHPATSGTAFSAMTTILQMKETEEEGWEYIRLLAQNMSQFTRSGRAPQTMVATGEYPIGIGFYDAVWQMQQEGYPLGVVFPSPIYAEPYSAAVIAGGPNTENAKRFFDYLLTKEAQEILITLGNYSVRTDVSSPKGGADLATLDILADDFVWATENQDYILEKFQAITHAQPR